MTNDLGTLLRSDRRDERARHGKHRRARGEPAGLGGDRLLVLAAAIWHDWTTRTSDKRSLTGCDH